MPKPDEVPEPVRRALAPLTQPQPMRRGSLGERLLKCGKARCACASDEQARHGPYFSLTRAVGGQTQSRRLTAEQAVRARRQLAAGRAFRQQLERYWEACEAWADAELQASTGAAAAAAEKGGSKPRSKPGWSKRSKPS